MVIPLKNHYPGLYLQTGRSTDSTHWQRADGDCLNSLGNNLLLIFATVATVGLLFFFTITIVVGVEIFLWMLR